MIVSGANAYVCVSTYVWACTGRRYWLRTGTHVERNIYVGEILQEDIHIIGT